MALSCRDKHTGIQAVQTMLTVTCVLRSGGPYTADWVIGLKDNVARFAPPHRFVCLSDVDVPCERLPLVTGWPGWWAKIELFRPGLFTGRVFYMDLDVLVTGDISPLCAGSGFAICQNFGASVYNSSAFAWDGGDTLIFDRFDPADMPRLGGDQDWIVECRPDAQAFPAEMAVSYNAHCSGRGMPPDARLIACHGRPKPPDIQDEWFRSRWLRDRKGDALVAPKNHLDWVADHRASLDRMGRAPEPG
jgi:hypothetical protein